MTECQYVQVAMDSNTTIRFYMIQFLLSTKKMHQMSIA